MTPCILFIDPYYMGFQFSILLNGMYKKNGIGKSLWANAFFIFYNKIDERKKEKRINLFEKMHSTSRPRIAKHLHTYTKPSFFLFVEITWHTIMAL